MTKATKTIVRAAFKNLVPHIDLDTVAIDSRQFTIRVKNPGNEDECTVVDYAAEALRSFFGADNLRNDGVTWVCNYRKISSVSLGDWNDAGSRWHY